LRDTLLQSLPLAEIAVSSRIRWLPRLSTHVPCAPLPTSSRSISPTPTLLTQSPGSQRALRKPIHRDRSRWSRTPGAWSSGTTAFRKLHPLRSVIPSPSPFASPGVAPDQRPLLSWSFVPS